MYHFRPKRFRIYPSVPLSQMTVFLSFVYTPTREISPFYVPRAWKGTPFWTEPPPPPPSVWSNIGGGLKQICLAKVPLCQRLKGWGCYRSIKGVKLRNVTLEKPERKPGPKIVNDKNRSTDHSRVSLGVLNLALESRCQHTNSPFTSFQLSYRSNCKSLDMPKQSKPGYGTLKFKIPVGSAVKKLNLVSTSIRACRFQNTTHLYPCFPSPTSCMLS